MNQGKDPETISFLSNESEKASIKVYPWTWYDFRVKKCDWRILAENEKRIVQACLNRENYFSAIGA